MLLWFKSCSVWVSPWHRTTCISVTITNKDTELKTGFDSFKQDEISYISWDFCVQNCDIIIIIFIFVIINQWQLSSSPINGKIFCSLFLLIYPDINSYFWSVFCFSWQNYHQWKNLSCILLHITISSFFRTVETHRHCLCPKTLQGIYISYESLTFICDHVDIQYLWS